MEKLYSHSKISCFEQCPLKYKFKYIEKIIPEIESSIEAHLGDSVHKTLEWLYLEVQKQRIPNIEQTINYYTSKWQENYSENFLIVNKEFSQEDYFNKGVKFLLDYYTENYPFNDNTLEVEKKIIIQLEEDIKVQGYIDRLAHNLETDEIEIHDYKTSNSLPEKEKIQKDRQLTLYAIAIKQEFGEQKKINLIWHYLAYNKQIKIQKTEQEIQEIKNQVLGLIKKIENTKEFNAKKSRLCEWCEYKNKCSEIENNKTIKNKKTFEDYPYSKKYIRED